MTAVLSQDQSGAEKCAQLVALANQAGGLDNITVLIGKYEQERK